MKISNTNFRFDRHTHRSADDGSDLSYLGDVLPQDFPERLEGLKEASGLSWGAMTRSIGVDRKQLMRWRKKGIEPCGGAMHAIFRFANRMSDGLDILMSDGSQMTFRGEER